MAENLNGYFRGLLRKAVRVGDGEIRALLWSCAYFFFLLSSFYVIRPLRDEMGVTGGGDKLNLLFLGTLAGTLVANPPFAALASRFPRRIFIPVVYRVLVAALLVFYLLFSVEKGVNKIQVARVFFVWASVFNLIAVSVFWGLMADLFRPEQGKRLFGFIGVGGTLGAIGGAALTAGLAPRVGPVNLLLLAAALLEAAIFSVRRLVRIFAVGPDGARVPDSELPPGRGVWSGIRLVMTSPYLLGICLFLFCFSLSSTFIYFEQARIAKATFADAAQRTAFFARIDLYVNLLTLLIQAFLSGRIISSIGVGPALALLPAFSLAGFVGLGFAPIASVLVPFQVMRRAAEYALARPAREVLFTVVNREEKYTSKNFIDTFVLRGGDAAGVWADTLLASLGVATAGVALTFAPVAGVWVCIALFLGKRHGALARMRELPL